MGEFAAVGFVPGPDGGWGVGGDWGSEGGHVGFLIS